MMSRPPGPPPYTAEQIALLATPTERFIAAAELNSYVAGHRLADLRERGLSFQPTYSLRNMHGADNVTPTGSSSPPFDETPPNLDVDEEYQPSSGWNSAGSRRRDTRKHGKGKANGGHQPYPSPHHVRSRNVDRSAGPNDATSRNGRSNRTTGRALCPSFTSTGNCARPRCPDVHDINQLALCKRWLYKDACTKGSRCSLSHSSTPNNTPHCLYHLEDRCTNSPCIFLHVHVDIAAPVCQSFGQLGYCSRGEDCSDLHVYECPDFANEGFCATGDQCPLRHVHHASRMKAAAIDSSGVGTPQIFDDADDTGDAGHGLDSPNENHAITQQHDYVGFEIEE